MAALYADENFAFPVVAALRAVGHDVLTALDDGKANQQIPDPDVLARAVVLGRALLTNNRKHFVRLHRASSAHAGIISCTSDLEFPALAGRIHAAITAVASLAGQLIRINKPNKPKAP